MEYLLLGDGEETTPDTTYDSNFLFQRKEAPEKLRGSQTENMNGFIGAK